MANKATAVDLGSHSAKVLIAEAGKHGVKVVRFAGLPRGEGEAAVSLRQAGIPLAASLCGLSGRDMTLRYSQVPPTPDWQLRNLMDLEIQDLAQQSGGTLSADYNLLPAQDPEAGVETVLLALAKDEALERLQGEITSGGGSVAAFVPNCTALYNAYLKCGPVEADAVVCLANIGHETIDIALVKGTDLLIARNLSGGTKVLDDAIGASFNVSGRKAEALKKDLLDLDPQSRGRYASGQAEKVTMAAGGAAQSISAAIQSSLSFCKMQTKIADLRLDKVLLSGGGARLRGLRGMLREALRCPIELFDPFANLDLSALPAADAEQLQAMRHEAVVALGLAVGRLDDTLYSLEILPEAVKKRLRFQQRTVWNILAGAIAVGVLALVAVDAKKSVETAQMRTSALRRESSSITQTHQTATEAIEANKVERAIVDHLATQALPGNGLLRTMRAVGKYLPPELWITKIDVGGVGQGSQKKRPVVKIEGGGKEVNGVNASRVFQEDFYSPLRRELEQSGAKVTVEPTPKADSIQFKITVEFGEGK
ncbi:MAG: pilus assembly protein PilM [Planctomycetes bacterium]|jgi:type IV pilus assembly protein PilM|nr:pilus assembly protein PilM [Planctomycetota bacterium]MCC7061468.1 pilus assembly protein PilM [Planctomycetota bacterium]